MRKCRECENLIPNRSFIDGKWRNLQRRVFCLECIPFGVRNTKPDITKKSETPVERVIRLRNYSKNRRIFNKNRAIEYMGGKCKICGYNKCIDAFDYHHLNPNDKEVDVSRIYTYSWKRIKSELDKCILLCANCHREVESGLHSHIK